MEDKRRFPRLDVDLPVTIRCDGRLIPATALNISSGGLCLSSEMPLPPNFQYKKIELIIDLSGTDRDVSVRGEVVHIDKGDQFRLGVKFTNLYTVGHQAVQEFVNSHLN